MVESAIKSKGNILELGCGNYSTPLLSAFARRNKGRLYVKSSNPEWAVKFKHQAEVEIVDWDKWSCEGKFGLIFIDSEEHHEARIGKLLALKDHAPIIVMHDCDEIMNDCRWPVIDELFDVEMFRTHSPWTMVFRCLQSVA
jgi:hypothetical protein